MFEKALSCVSFLLVFSLRNTYQENSDAVPPDDGSQDSRKYAVTAWMNTR